MNRQSGLVGKLLSIIYRGCVDIRGLIHACIAWSPFLIKVFNGIIVRKLKHLFGLVLKNPTNIGANVMFYHPGDTSLILSLKFGRFEPEVKKTIVQFLRPGMTMIDAGANIGYYTLLAARMVGPHGHVYAFEPVPPTIELLRKNVELNGYSNRVTIVPKALTNKNSQVRIFYDGEASAIGSSIVDNGHKSGFVDVEGVSADEFFSKEGWPPIHIIKMDIEGAEKLALDGMRELSHRNPESKLIIEVNSLYSVEELIDALLACGFSSFYVLEHNIRVGNIHTELPRIVPQKEFTIVNLLCEKAN